MPDIFDTAEFLTEEEERGVLDARQKGRSSPAAEAPDTSVGKIGERLACRSLWRRGFRILERNFQGQRGEIDVVAEKRERIHFVEVKTSAAGSVGRPEERVDAKKRELLRRAAQEYLDGFGEAPPGGVQFDVLALTLNQRGGIEDESLFEGAF